MIGSTLGKADRVNRWEMVAQTVPGITPVSGQEKIARGTAKSQRLFINVQRMSEDDVITMFLRQAIAQLRPALTAILRTPDTKRPIYRHAHIVADSGHYPCGLIIFSIDDDREAEMNRAARL